MLGWRSGEGEGGELEKELGCGEVGCQDLSQGFAAGSLSVSEHKDLFLHSFNWKCDRCVMIVSSS